MGGEKDVSIRRSSYRMVRKGNEIIISGFAVWSTLVAQPHEKEEHIPPYLKKEGSRRWEKHAQFLKKQGYHVKIGLNK